MQEYKTATDLIEKIKGILVKYGNTQELSQLIIIYEKLSLNLVFLGEELSHLKQNYNMSHYDRKISISHSYLNNKKEKITDSQALKLAETENKEKIQKELELESLANRLDTFRMQGNKVMDAMRTRISFEKGELQRVKSDDLI